MKKYITAFILVFVFASIAFISSCKKDNYVNPYDDPALQAPDKNPNPDNLSPGNIAYLHNKIFKPTCANSGCHDGTFAPDFRTINSTYNTLVYQKPVKQIVDDANPYSFQYRVWPFKGDSSVLYKRLTFHRDTFAERMPLAASGDPFPYWVGKEAEYTLAIKNWINAGAKDMFGNFPSSGNLQPQITGLAGFNSGSISGSFSRGGGQYPPIEIPAGNIDLWFLTSDDSTAVSAFSYLKCKVLFDMYDTTGAMTLPITYEPAPANQPSENDFNDNGPYKFTHKVSINTSTFATGTHLFIRAYIDDNDQGAPTEIPNAGSDERMMGYFALKVQ